jgi:hypothetical protein
LVLLDGLLYRRGVDAWIGVGGIDKDSQIFPSGYKVFRNYRNLLGGRVLIAVKDTHIATAVPELNTDC